MSFYLRKLRALRLMPSAKRSLGFGFSTRVNEREKNLCNSSEDKSALTDECVSSFHESERFSQGDETKTDLNVKENCFLVPITPPASDIFPVSPYDALSIALDRSAVLRLSSSPVQVSLSSKDVLDLFSDSVKSIRLTSDDILVNSLRFCDGARFEYERTLVDVLRQESDNVGSVDSGSLERLSFPAFTQTSTFDSSDFLTPTSPCVVMDSSTSADSCSVQTLHYSSGGGGGATNGEKNNHGPTPEQMHNAREPLENLVINLFNGRHNYGILHKNVTLENNLFGHNTVCVGTLRYALELMKLRLQVHIRYSSTDMEILNVTTLEKNGIIRIHWRLKGVPQTQVLKFWKMFHINKDEVEWIEAFSYFHIGKDGSVHKHRIDRMIPDSESETSKLTSKLQKLVNPAKPLVT